MIVVGSINMDLVVGCDRMPQPGQTVVGRSFTTSPGGKGANQAVGAARLAARCVMIGRVGEDAFGRELIDGLSREGVDVEHVSRTAGVATGVALIHVDGVGRNAITVVPGANHALTPDDVEAAAARFAEADVLMLQLETPVETIEAALRVAKRFGVRTMLDPAPPPIGGLPAALREVDILLPNQHEAEAITGVRVDTIESAGRAAARLCESGAMAAVVKLAADGAVYLTGSQPPIHCPAPRVAAVDTTAAGDAFAAGLAVALAERMGWDEAMRLACCAGALAATRHGAQRSMPSRRLVEALAANAPRLSK